jgi:hypothetical protein
MQQILPLRAVATTKFKAAVKCNAHHRTLAEAITIVYTTTPDDVLELRNIVVDTLTTDKTLLRREDIKTAVCGLNRLSFELFTKVLPKVDVMEEELEQMKKRLDEANRALEDVRKGPKKCVRCQDDLISLTNGHLYCYTCRI